MLTEYRHTLPVHVKHTVPLTTSPDDDGISPSYQPVPVEPHKFSPGVVNGSVEPPVPINLIQTGLLWLRKGGVLSQPSA
jgi:hypothetical protein